MFLQTRDGLVNVRAIVRMFPCDLDGPPDSWWIDYELGGRALNTRALEADVLELKKRTREP